MPIEYAQALYNSLRVSKNKSETVDEFISILRNHGKMKALPTILKEIERLYAKEYSKEPILYIAKKEYEATALKLLKEKISTDPIVKVNDFLIGGWRFVGANMLIDNSYKAALLKLYKQITA